MNKFTRRGAEKRCGPSKSAGKWLAYEQWPAIRKATRSAFEKWWEERKNTQFPKPFVRIDFFKEGRAPYFGKRSGSSPPSLLRSRIMPLISETRHQIGRIDLRFV
jgi:hypothetical protein